MKRRTACHRLVVSDMRSGFTVIEVLIGIAIAAVTVALVFSLYHTVGRVVDGQQKRLQEAYPRAMALDQMALDFMGAFHLPEDEGGWNLVTEDQGHGARSTLSFTTTLRVDDQVLWHTVSRVTYAPEPLRDGKLSLTRSVQPTTGPRVATPVEPQVVANQLKGFRVEVHVEGEWLENWSSTEGGAWPQAARVHVWTADAHHDDPIVVLIPIPAGRMFTPHDAEDEH